MLITIIKNNKIRPVFLPAKVYGNYWITDENKQNLINIEASNNTWVLRSNDDVKIVNKDMYLDSAFLLNYSYCFLKSLKTNETFIIYCSPTYDETFINLGVTNNTEITIGKSMASSIVYENPNISENHCKITYINNTWSFQTLDSKLTFINNNLAKDGNLFVGDSIFIMGLKIIIGTDYIIIGIA